MIDKLIEFGKSVEMPATYEESMSKAEEFSREHGLDDSKRAHMLTACFNLYAASLANGSAEKHGKWMERLRRPWYDQSDDEWKRPVRGVPQGRGSGAEAV